MLAEGILIKNTEIEAQLRWLLSRGKSFQLASFHCNETNYFASLLSGGFNSRLNSPFVTLGLPMVRLRAHLV